MRTALVLGLLALGLVACGGPSGGGARDSAANNEACALVKDAPAVFGDNPDIVGTDADAPSAAYCELSSADGKRSGGVLLFTQESLGAVSPADQVATLVQSWDNATETPLQPMADLSEDARLATDLPGYQTQIVFAKGHSVVAVLGSSGDAHMSGEQIARALAEQAVANLVAN